jgi:hypothetical protein
MKEIVISEIELLSLALSAVLGLLLGTLLVLAIRLASGSGTLVPLI